MRPTCEVDPTVLNRLSGSVLSSELELKVQVKARPAAGLALTEQLMEAISPCATPYTIFWWSAHTGLSAIMEKYQGIF